MDHPNNGSNWGSASSGAVTYATLIEGDADLTSSMSGGVDSSPTDADLQTGYALFANDELVDVNLIMAGGHSQTVGDYIIDNVAEIRKDCMVFISPQKTSVVNNSGSEATDAIAELASYTRSSYAV